MSFIATPQQIEAFQRRISNPSYSQEAIQLEFTTTHEFIAQVLPPTLEPAESATGLVSISTWRSDVCGSFGLSSISLKCIHNGREGYWILHLIVNDSFAVTWGRETWGEAKKAGQVHLSSRGAYWTGYTERHGVRLIEIEAEFDAPSNTPKTVEWFDFEIKAFPSASGIGLHSDPLLLTLGVRDTHVTHATGKGKLTLKGTQNDPLHAIPIQSIADCCYYQGPSEWHIAKEGPMCPAGQYMPYFVARHYDRFIDLAVGEEVMHMDREEDTVGLKEQRSWKTVN